MKKPSIALLLVITLSGCMGYVPGQQSYWDAQVREMCAKDGGVKIIEKLRLSKEDVNLLGSVDGNIRIPSKKSAHPNAPAYSELNITYVRNEGNPSVWRAESLIKRRLDQVVIARWVTYTRSGGDIPTGLVHDSSFTCPDLKKITSDLQLLFIVEGDSK